MKGFPVAIFAKYEANVNTAVKGAAIAAARLEKKGRYVGLQAQFRENRNELTLLVVDIRPRYDKYTSNILTVASHTDYKVLGGAIASRVRDSVDTMQRGGGGPPILLRAIGKRAVWAATRAIAVTREYLEESGPNIFFLPHFNVVQLPNRLEPSTVLEFYIFPSSDSSSSS